MYVSFCSVWKALFWVVHLNIFIHNHLDLLSDDEVLKTSKTLNELIAYTDIRLQLLFPPISVPSLFLSLLTLNSPDGEGAASVWLHACVRVCVLVWNHACMATHEFAYLRLSRISFLYFRLLTGAGNKIRCSLADQKQGKPVVQQNVIQNWLHGYNCVSPGQICLKIDI